MQNFLQDLRFGVRMLAKNRGFTAIAIITLALGIGENTAIFSVVNSVLLKPLPFPNSERLVWLSERAPDFPSISIAYPNFEDWQRQQTVFEHLGAYRSGSFSLTQGGDPVRLEGDYMGSSAFAALQVQPILGRFFVEEDDKPGAASVVVLNHALWQNRFGKNSAILNQSITLDGKPHTVIGVMPPGFAFPGPADLWVSMGALIGNPDFHFQDRGYHSDFFAVARLKNGVSIAQARASMDAIAVRLEQQYPDKNKHQRVRMDALLDSYVSNFRRLLWTLLGAVGLVLLIACTNVANLLLARAAARQKEIALRAALGAARSRIVRQLVTESLLLACAGGALGLLLAHAGMPLILSLGRGQIPRAAEAGLDVNVLIFTALAAVCTGILFGLAPAWQASRPDLQEVLNSASRGSTGGRSRLRHGLVVTEVAVTLILLAGAGLLLRSFNRLQQVKPGFIHEGVVSFRFDLIERKHPGEEQAGLFYQAVLERVRALPGVQSAGVASRLPLDPKESSQTDFTIEGQPQPPPRERPNMELAVVGPDYFRTLHIPLIRGRSFNDRDDRSHLQGKGLRFADSGERWIAGLSKIMVDEEFARRYWPNEDPIGQHVRLPWNEKGPVLEVVGVVGRVKLDRLSEPAKFVQGYISFLQAPRRGMAVVVRTTLPPETLIAAVRKEMLALDPEQPIYDIRTLAEIRDNSIAPQKVNLLLLSIFAGVALVLAAIGLYGVLAYAVTQRQREIGVRVALGAQRADVLKLIVRHGMLLTLVGIAIGLAASFALTRALSTLLYEVKPSDPVTFAAVAGLLTLVSLAACLIPARRASKVDPIAALRCE